MIPLTSQQTHNCATPRRGNNVHDRQRRDRHFGQLGTAYDQKRFCQQARDKGLRCDVSYILSHPVQPITSLNLNPFPATATPADSAEL